MIIFSLYSASLIRILGVNKRISRQRAEAVKIWLAKNGIEANRITAIGNGSDGTQDADKARRVETKDNHQ